MSFLIFIIFNIEIYLKYVIIKKVTRNFMSRQSHQFCRMAIAGTISGDDCRISFTHEIVGIALRRRSHVANARFW